MAKSGRSDSGSPSPRSALRRFSSPSIRIIRRRASAVYQTIHLGILTRHSLAPLSSIALAASQLLGAGEHLGVGAGGAGAGAGVPRRKSSGGFVLFSGKNGDASHAQEEGNESPGKEGSRWGFLRRGSQA